MDKEMALEMARIDCEGVQCISGTVVCCSNEIPQPPCQANEAPDCKLTEMIVKEVTFGDQRARFAVPKGDAFISRFSGIAENGNSIGASSRVYDSRQKAREAAWSEFAPRVSQNGGLRPGTLVNRTVNAFFYRCRVRVRSEYQMTLYDQDVEATGMTLQLATTEAWKAAVKLADLLKVTGHTNVVVAPGVQCDRVLNSLANVCKPTFSCRHQCTANDDWKIVVGRRGTSRAQVCCEAAGAARVLADGHGGVKLLSCRTLVDVVNANAAKGTTKSAGCSGCGN